MPLVSVRRVDDYNQDALYDAICSHFETLRIADDLTPETRVVLKPNLLAGRDPSLAVTTHPAVLQAIAHRLRELGVRHITLADSPGGIYTPAALRKVYAACKMTALAEVLTLNEDVSFAEKNGFAIIRPVLEADFIIDCAKLKTHGFTTVIEQPQSKTCLAVCRGFKKPELHYQKPTIDSFSAMLMDLCETVKPHLTIMDAVECMEGNGPGERHRARIWATRFASRDVYAIDEAGVAADGHSAPSLAPLIRLARKRSLMRPRMPSKRRVTRWSPATPAVSLLPDTIITQANAFAQHQTAFPRHAVRAQAHLSC